MLASEILESYDRSPFLARDAENFLDSRDRAEYQGEITFETLFQILHDTHMHKVQDIIYKY